MEIEDPRLALSALLRRAAPGIIRRLVTEAIRSSGASPEEAGIDEALMTSAAPAILDAVAADDATRVRTFARASMAELDGMRTVPPVARMGLLEIAFALARDEVAAAARDRADRAAIERELVLLVEQMRAALVAFGAAEDRG